MTKPACLAFLLFFTFLVGYSQPVAPEFPEASSVLIFEVSGKEARQLHRQRRPNIADKYLHTQVDSLAANEAREKQLPSGHYIYCWIESTKEVRTLFSFHNLRVNVLDHPQEIRLRLTDKDAQVIENATVRYGRSTLIFDPAAQLYVGKGGKRRGNLRVRHGDQELIARLYNSHHRKPPKYLQAIGKQFKTASQGISRLFSKELKGYVAISQPRYRPGDTLRIKAYVVNARGKPFRAPLQMVLYAFGGSDQIIKQELHPSKPGVHLLELPLPDSLKIDQQYRLRINVASKKDYKSNLAGRFKLEDYLLDEAHFELTTQHARFGPKDTVAAQLRAEDPNGLPLPNVQARLQLKVREIRQFEQHSKFVPDTAWVQQVDLGENGNLKVILPEKLFQGLKAQYELQVDFRSNSNELQSLSKVFEVDHRDAAVPQLNHQNGILSGTGNAGTAILSQFSNGDTLSAQKVTLPFRIRPEPRADYFVLQQGNKWTALNLPHSSCASIRIWRTSRPDSVIFVLKNPKQIAGEFQLTKGKTLLRSGKTAATEQQFPVQIEGNATYRLQFRYAFWGHAEMEEAEISAAPQQLTVNLEQPLRVQPGETHQLRVQVRDAKGNTVKGVDLTSAGISSKFRESGAPQLPQFSKHTKVQRNPRKYSYNIYVRTLQDKHDVTPATRSKFGLENSAWFKMRFPPQGWFSTTLTPPDSITQFAPFLVQNGALSGCDLIKVDGKVVYFNDSKAPPNYAVAISPGYHHLELFSNRAEVEVENVFFAKGKKTELFIDINHPAPACRVRKNPRFLSIDEADELNAQLLWILDYDHRGILLIGQNEKRALIKSNGNWASAGVFQPGKVWMLAPETSDTIWIDFEPGTAYMFTDGYMLRRTIGKALQVDKLRDTGTHAVGAFLNSQEWHREMFAAQRTVLSHDFPWDYHTSNIELQLRFEPFQDFAFLLLINTDSATTQILKPEKISSVSVEPGILRILICDRNGKYWEYPPQKLQAAGRYLRTLNPNDKSPSARPAEELYTARGKPIRLKLFEAMHVLSEVGGVKISYLNGFHSPSKSFFSISALRSRKTFRLDDSGTRTIPLSQAGWYELTVAPKYHLGKGETQTFYWEPGRLLEKTLTVRPDNSPYGNSSYGAFRTPPTIRFPRFRIFRSRFRNLPPRRGTRTNYIDNWDGGPGVILYAPKPGAKSYNEEAKVEKQQDEGGLRENFADIAWWETGLVTDENGEAFFQVTFPDDLSQWNAWVAAMNAKRQTGMTTGETRAYRDLVAALSLPRFLLAGDTATVQGIVTNHTPSAIPVATTFALGDSILQRNQLNLRKQESERLPLPAQGDSLKLRYALTRSNGYTDGEVRTIPILPRGLNVKKGGFLLLAKDSIITIAPNPELGPIHLQATARPLDVFLEAIQGLEAYPYACMEQTASRLLALLARKRIQNALSLKFQQEKDIRKLIRRLESAQHARGSWGWWYEPAPNYFMTAYVCQALQSAAREGFPSPALEKGKAFLTAQLPQQTNAKNLILLRIAAELGLPLDYASKLQPYSMLQPSMYDQLQLVRIRQKAGLPYDAKALLTGRQRSLTGGTYWSTPAEDLLHNPVQATLLAYRIFSEAPDGARQLSGIRRYFLERGQGGLGNNTLEAASIIETLLPFYLGQPYRSTTQTALLLQAGGNRSKLSTYPAKEIITDLSGPVLLRKSGPAPLYLSWYQEHLDANPTAKTELFDAQSHFEQAGKLVKQAATGLPLTMVIQLKAQQPAEYVLVEIPIPAGCAYGNKAIGKHPREVHREYFKDKVAIFFQKLPSGDHTLRIDLEPRYAGSYSLNPIRIEPMYFPTLSGNSALRNLYIR